MFAASTVVQTASGSLEMSLACGNVSHFTSSNRVVTIDSKVMRLHDCFYSYGTIVHQIATA